MKAGAILQHHHTLPLCQATGFRRPDLVICGFIVLGLASGMVSGTALAQVVIGGEGLPGVEVNLGVLDILPNRALQQQLQLPGAVAPGPFQLQAPGAPAAPAPAPHAPVFTPPPPEPAPPLTPAPQPAPPRPALPQPAPQLPAPPAPDPLPMPQPAPTPAPDAGPAPAPAPAIVGPLPAPAPAEVPIPAAPAAPIVAAPGPAPAPALAPAPQGVAGAPVLQEPQAPQPRGAEVANVAPTPAPAADEGLAADGFAPGGGPLSRIEFLGANTILPTEVVAVLTEIAALVANTDRRIQLNAYAGGTAETVSAARRLSLSRALTVRSFLIEAGVRSTRIDVRALGLAEDDGPPERVDILLLAL